MKSEAKKIIKQLENNDFYIQCPCCDEPVKARDAGLFYLNDFSEEGKEAYDAWQAELKEAEKKLKQDKIKAKTRSTATTKAVNFGFISERLAPVLKDFKFNHNDCRSMFDPIDYVIFEGLSK